MDPEFDTKKKSISKSPIEKLNRRIEREFKKCTYVGDININDEEYSLLMEYIKNYYAFWSKYQTIKINSSLAVALVQIGIRYYDGKIWAHIEREFGNVSINQQSREWLGQCYYCTLVKYNKFHVDANEIRNNILMHCFITKHYANDLFDFLFAYYQLDLDRDLSRHNKDMRELLMRSMAKGENSIRGYKIKRHTADAVAANEHGCKIRVSNILKFMDKALFDSELPENSKNRVTQFFVEWAKTSGKFDAAKKKITGRTRSGVKQFYSPDLYIDYKNEQFELVLPRQNITLRDDEPTPDILWRVSCGEQLTEINVPTRDSVIGCRTEPVRLPVTADEIFKGFKLSIIKNDNENARQPFYINADSVRFFDKEGYMVLPDCIKGELYALCREDEQIRSEAIYDKERFAGLVLMFLTLNDGDLILRSDDSMIYVGRAPAEGLLERGKVSGVMAQTEDGNIPVFSEIPSVYFRMSAAQENGLLIYLNEKPYRFDAGVCTRFKDPQNPKGNGYILRLNRLISDNGKYSVIIDIPNSKKNLCFEFTYINGFSFDFVDAPYVFKEHGNISFSREIDVQSMDQNVEAINGEFRFPILPERETLNFSIISKEQKPIRISVELPVLQWKFDDEEWSITQPDEIWHKEFPNVIHLKYPANRVYFSMPPLFTIEQSEDGEDQNFSVAFDKLKNESEFTCDTRKMRSWFGSETELRPLRLTIDEIEYPFATVVTKCIVTGCSVTDDRTRHELIFKFDIIGFSDCVVDIDFGQDRLADKIPVTTGGIRLQVPLRSGYYDVAVYEWDEDEDDFGFGEDASDYTQVYKERRRYYNPYDVTGKMISVIGIEEKQKAASVFLPKKYSLSDKLSIKDLREEGDTLVGYIGDVSIVVNPIKDLESGKAEISFFDPEEECYCDFLFDLVAKHLVYEEAQGLSFDQSRKRYIYLDPDDWIFNIEMKKES